SAGHVDRAVALNDVVAVLPEDQVVPGTACDVVVPEAVRGRGRAEIEQREPEVAPPRRALRVELPRLRDERLARRSVVDLCAAERAEQRAREVTDEPGAIERRVVACDQIVSGTRVDHVVGRAAYDYVLSGAGPDGVVGAEAVGDRGGLEKHSGALQVVELRAVA